MDNPASYDARSGSSADKALTRLLPVDADNQTPLLLATDTEIRSSMVGNYPSSLIRRLLRSLHDDL